MAWGEPVDIQLYGFGKYQVVTNTPMASECLLNYWPEGAQGEEYQDALQAASRIWRGCRILPGRHLSKPQKRRD